MAYAVELVASVVGGTAKKFDSLWLKAEQIEKCRPETSGSREDPIACDER